MSESRGVVLGWECHPVFCHRRHRALIWLMSFPAAIGRLLTFCHHLKHLRRIRPANSLHFNWRGVYKTLRMGRARGLRKNNSDPQRRVINNVSGQEGATITEHGLRILALLARKRKESKLRELWWRCPGLNGGPAAYESAALPTELHRQGSKINELRSQSQAGSSPLCPNCAHQPFSGPPLEDRSGSRCYSDRTRRAFGDP
jgi:hypothetical protein